MDAEDSQPDPELVSRPPAGHPMTREEALAMRGAHAIGDLGG